MKDRSTGTAPRYASVEAHVVEMLLFTAMLNGFSGRLHCTHATSRFDSTGHVMGSLYTIVTRGGESSDLVHNLLHATQLRAVKR